MPDGETVNYRYDGSFDGLLCCVFESFDKKEIPQKINGPDAVQLSLFTEKEIVTDEEKARRVLASIPKKIGPDALSFVRRAYLTCLPQKEWYILLFLRKGYRVGGKIMHMLSDDVVNVLFKAVQQLGNEAHLLKEFIRFSVYDNVLAAQITPKNFVLPFLGQHFAERFPNEAFLIYDTTHSMVLTYEKSNMQIRPVEHFSMPAPSEEEKRFRRMWKMFYETIAIKERYNPRCRMNMMPKRYWANMTEFAAETDKNALLPVKI